MRAGLMIRLGMFLDVRDFLKRFELVSARNDLGNLQAKLLLETISAPCNLQAQLP